MKREDWEQAKVHIEWASERNRRVYGDRAPATHMVNKMLGSLYEKLGRWDEAETLYEEGVDALGEKLGLLHPATLRTVSSLARLYVIRGRPQEAEALARGLLEKMAGVGNETQRAKAVMMQIIERATGGGEE